MKLWLDDIRPAPEGWHWAKTLAEAKEAVLNNEIEEMSLDHDLGAEFLGNYEELTTEELRELMFVRGIGETTGYDFVNFLCITGFPPVPVTIHSWNPEGAMNMYRRFEEYGWKLVQIVPYRFA